MNKMNVNTLVEQLNNAEMRTINGGIMKEPIWRTVTRFIIERLIGLPIQRQL